MRYKMSCDAVYTVCAKCSFFDFVIACRKIRHVSKH